MWPATNPYQADPGHAAVLNFYITPTSISRLDGAAFDFHSIDMEDGYNGGSAILVSFTFLLHDGTSVSQLISLDSIAGLQTLSFDKLGVTKVSWYPLGSYAQFDNINVTSIPEPETAAMLLLGLATLSSGLVRRRRASL